MNTIGENLKRCRKECGYTPRKLAELCGLDVECVKEIEAGNAVPFPETVKELADAVRVRPERIYGITPLEGAGGICTQMEKLDNKTTVYISCSEAYKLVSLSIEGDCAAIGFCERGDESDG